MKPYTVITDPGHDDLIALCVLKACTPQVKHTILATYGNVKLDHTFQNAKEFIALAVPYWKIGRGSRKPLSGKEPTEAEAFHGPDGVWEVHPDVVTNSVKEIKTVTEGQNIISLGSMTDVWKLYSHTRSEEVTVMGGAFDVIGNEEDHSEFNIAVDPDAAAKFFKNCEDTTVRVIPLDATRKVFWTIDQAKKMPEDTLYKKWVKDLILIWFDNCAIKEDFILHDPLAIFLAFHPEHAVWKRTGIEVITNGKLRGKTIFSNKNPRCLVAIDIVDPVKTSQAIYDFVFSS